MITMNTLDASDASCVYADPIAWGALLLNSLRGGGILEDVDTRSI